MIKKTITSLDLDLSDISQNGENRTFTILGQIGATFSMEVKNEDSYYYNFQTGSFQAAQTRLTNEVIPSGGYVNNIQQLVMMINMIFIYMLEQIQNM